MYIVRIDVLKEYWDQLITACDTELAPAEDYPKIYGPNSPYSTTIRSIFALSLILFRLHLKEEDRREHVEIILRHANLGVATCDFCHTVDWDKHRYYCPIDTPEGSPEREANRKGGQDGQQGLAPAEPENPIYMLGYNWGIHCKRWWDQHPDGY